MQFYCDVILIDLRFVHNLQKRMRNWAFSIGAMDFQVLDFRIRFWLVWTGLNTCIMEKQNVEWMWQQCYLY